LPAIPQPLADAIRASLLAPAGVELVLVGKAACVYNFRDDAARGQLGKTTHVLPAHQWLWLK
jgi:hypothetical protein